VCTRREGRGGEGGTRKYLRVRQRYKVALSQREAPPASARGGVRKQGREVSAQRVGAEARALARDARGPRGGALRDAAGARGVSQHREVDGEERVKLRTMAERGLACGSGGGARPRRSEGSAARPCGKSSGVRGGENARTRARTHTHTHTHTQPRGYGGAAARRSGAGPSLRLVEHQALRGGRPRGVALGGLVEREEAAVARLRVRLVRGEGRGVSD